LAPAELPGELFLPLKRRNNKRDPRILVFSEATKPKLKENSTNIAMRSLTSLIINS
jgi:hypothetical protein